MMNSISRYTICLLATVSITLHSFSQSPWVIKGEGYAHISAGSFGNYSTIFQGYQKEFLELDGTISETSIQAYAEYAWTNKIATVIDLPYNFISSKTNSQTPSIRTDGSISGIGNVGLGLKYNFLKKPFLLTGQLNIKLPSSSANEATGLRTGYEALSLIPTLSAGKGYENSYFYVYGGADFFTDDISNSIRFGIEYGHHFIDKFWLMITFNTRESLKNGNRVYNETFEDSFLFVNNQSYTTIAFKAIYEFNENFGMNCAGNLISFRANNLPRKAPFSIGFYYKWK